MEVLSLKWNLDSKLETPSSTDPPIFCQSKSPKCLRLYPCLRAVPIDYALISMNLRIWFRDSSALPEKLCSCTSRRWTAGAARLTVGARTRFWHQVRRHSGPPTAACPSKVRVASRCQRNHAVREQQPQQPSARDDLTSTPVRLSVSTSKKEMLLLAGDLESDPDDSERDNHRERNSFQ